MAKNTQAIIGKTGGRICAVARVHEQIYLHIHTYLPFSKLPTYMHACITTYVHTYVRACVRTFVHTDRRTD